MKVVASTKNLTIARRSLSSPIGLVPTMGYLHEGHLALVRKAKIECECVVVTIYVNPTQFGPTEDFDAYPRDLERDLRLLENAGADLVWMPANDEMYPAGYQTWVTVEEVTRPLEGALRQGHFRGVTTIVAKLFNAVRPDRVYFGQKDAQQVAVIKQMIHDLSYPIEMVVYPTVRESDGLAMSSRNTYLNPSERAAAVVLNKALMTAKDAYLGGERSGERLREIMYEVLRAEPLAKPLYVSCADLSSLQELSTVTNGALLSMAVNIGKTRLIDNQILEPDRNKAYAAND